MALIVEGEIVLGVMGCPNWQDEHSDVLITGGEGDGSTVSRSGIIMISHAGCGTWKTRLLNKQVYNSKVAHNWTRCFVDGFHNLHEARFCIPESQKWESLPMSTKFNATTDADCVNEKQILLLSLCCGRLIS